MSKPAREFSVPPRDAWAPTPLPGVSELLLADDGAGVATRLVRLEPGAHTRRLGAFVHEFWEEAYILDGSVRDLTRGETSSAGAYACRPPGMAHGPIASQEGCVVLEVRYR
jgi:hypothetical protein